MASGGAEEDDGSIPLDIDNVHMLLQVEHEQIQKRTFTNWINAQLSKRSPPSYVSDLFSDLRDGSALLDLLEVMSCQSMKRQRGHGVFQQRANIETALSFLRKKSIKLVNINIPDIIDGRPSIILGLIWTIILHCHIEELASTISFSSRHSSLDSLASLDSCSSSPVPASPVPAEGTSPLHRRFRISAKKALLMWVRDQCQKVHCNISVKDFKSSWRNGEAFLAILCSLRPELVDLSLVRCRSNQENLEEAFHLAERELRIPRLLEPQDVDVRDPDEKSIMTYVAQFLQYSNDMPAPDDHLQLFPFAHPSIFSPVSSPAHFTPAIAVSPLHQVSPSERAREVTYWLQEACEELSETWAAAERSSYAERYQVFQRLASSFTEQRRPVMTLFAAIKRCPELSQEQHALKTAWDHLEEELQRCKADLDLSLPPPLDSVVAWLQRAETALKEVGGKTADHAEAAKEARARQENLKSVMKEMSYYAKILEAYHNVDDSGITVVPLEKFEEIKHHLTNIQVTAKYEGIKLEYQESRHTVLDLLKHIGAKVESWKTPYRSQETIQALLQDWHETVERRGLLLILMDALQNLKENANAFTSKASLGEDSQRVTRQVREAESEGELLTQAVTAARGMMERVESAWEVYSKLLISLQPWLSQRTHLEAQSPAVGVQDMSEWASCHAQLNEVGNYLTEVTETTTSLLLAEQLSKVNMQWAEIIKKTMFDMPAEPSVGASSLRMVHSLFQEANLLSRQPLEVASGPLKTYRQKLQSLKKKMSEVDVSSLTPSPEFQPSHMENLQQTLPQMLAEAERTCGRLQQPISKLEQCLAKLNNWNTEALDCCNQLQEKTHRRLAALESPAKVISRGLLLARQVQTEEHNLQKLVAELQKTSRQSLSTSGMQDRISAAVSQCQETLGKFSNLGFKQQVGELPELKSTFKTTCQPKTGSYVVARTKYVSQIGNVRLQAQDPNQTPSHMFHQSTRALQGSENQHVTAKDGKDIVVPQEEIRMASHPLREPILNIQPFAPTVKKAQSELLIQLKPFSKSQASIQNDQPAVRQTAVGSKCEALFTHMLSSGIEQKKCSTAAQDKNTKLKSQTGVQEDTSQSPTCPQPPFMIHSEVHSKAQSMARSRLEKARLRLQGRIQQAMKLFGGKEMSESQVKKKQKALKILQTSMLEEFLGAVEGFAAFCSGPQLQDLMLLSDSVKKQWEDVCREMAAFLPVLSSKIRGREQPFSVLQSEMNTNTFHEDTDQTDHDPLQQQQTATDGAASTEERAESLRELCESLTPRQSSSPAEDLLTAVDETQEIQARDTKTQPKRVAPAAPGFPLVNISYLSRGRQLEESILLSPADMPANVEPGSSLALKQNMDGSQMLLPVKKAVPVQFPDDTPMERKDPRTRSKGREPGQKQKPAVGAKEQLLKVHLLHIQESSRQTQTQIQTVVRSNTVESKQEAERTVISAPLAPPQVEYPSAQEVERMTSLEKSASLMKSADDLKALITEKLNLLLKSVDISSLTLSESTIITDLKEMDHTLQAEMRKLLKQSTEEERQEPGSKSPSSLSQELQNRFHDLKQLRQQLEDVQSAAEALYHFLATLRVIKAEIPALLADQDPSRQKDQEQERRFWQASMQRLQPAVEQADVVDRSLKAVGMTLTMESASVTCQDVVKSVSRYIVEMEEELAAAERKQKGEEPLLLEKEAIKSKDEVKLTVVYKTKAGNGSTLQSEALVHSTPSRTDEESGFQTKRIRQEEDDESNTQKEEESQAGRSEESILKTKSQKQRRQSSQMKKEGREKERLAHRTADMLATLRETKGAAEQLRLQELTLPALQQRTRVLTELESPLAGLLSEMQYLCGAQSRPGILEETQTSELKGLWEETTKAVTERLEQCSVLTELLKRFQSVRAELSGTLQRAESTISEHASYMGRENLQRLHTKVQETKAELSGLGDDIEEVRSVSRKLHTHLRQIPGCTAALFESEADALMDRWLDLSERTDFHLESLHRCLALWDGVLQLWKEVGSWTDDKLATFAQCPSFQTEDDIKLVQNEIMTQEESIQRFHQRATEIQALLQSTESPLELQVLETQMWKKIEQLKELVSEAEDVFKQIEATKNQILGRMEECFSSLQKTEDALLSLSAQDVKTVLAKLKELCWQLHTQDEQAESLLEDMRVMASIASPESLQSLSARGTQLQEKVTHIHQLFSDVEEQTEKNIKDLDRLETEKEHVERWLDAAEEEGAAGDDLSLLQGEALHQRAKIEQLSCLMASLQSSSLRQSALLEQSSKLLERYHSFHTNVLVGSKEAHSSLSRDIEAFKALAKSTQSWVEDLRPAGSPLDGSCGIQTPVEESLHHAQTVLTATPEGEARLEDLRIAGNGLSQKLLNSDDLKQEVQETVQKLFEQWRDLLQSVQPYYGALQADPEPASLYLARRQEARCRVEELQHRTDQLHTSFPWPGSAERAQACLTACQLQEEAQSLQVILTALDEQRRDLADKTSNTVWKDSSWAELDTCWSALKEELKGLQCCLEEGVRSEEEFGLLLQDCHRRLSSLQEKMSLCQAPNKSSPRLNTDVSATEALLQEVTNLERDLSQLTTLSDSITSSVTAEAAESISQQVINVQNHKRAIESRIREHEILTKVNQTVHHVEEEANSLQTALRDLAGNVEVHKELPDVSQLKQQWCTIQDCDKRLAEVEARVGDLRRTRAPSGTREILPADVLLTVNKVYTDADSLRSIFVQKKQECVENTAKTLGEVINQLQRWTKTQRTEPSPPSQAAHDEGLQLQQVVQEVLAEHDFLKNLLGAEVATSLEKRASSALCESRSGLESPSKCLVVHSNGTGHLGNNDMTPRSHEDSLRNEDATSPSASADKTTVICSQAFPSSSAAESEEDSAESTFSAETDASKHDQACASFEKEDTSAMHSAGSFTENPSSIPVATPDDASDNPATQAENFKTFPGTQKQEIQSFTGVLVTEPPDKQQRDNTGICHPGCSEEAELSAAKLVEFPEKSPGLFTTVSPETDKADLNRCNSAGLSEFSKAGATEAKENHEHDSDVSRRSDQVFTVVLEMQAWDVKQTGNFGASSDGFGRSQGAELDDAKSTEMPNTGLPEGKSKPSTTLISPEITETKSKSQLQTVHPGNSTLLCKEKPKYPELKNTEGLTGLRSCCSAAEHQHTGAQAAEMTFPSVSQEQVTDFCQAVSPVWCTEEHSARTGEALTGMQRLRAGNEQLMAADAETGGGAASEEVLRGRAEQDGASKKPGALEDMTVATEQCSPQIQDSMEPERAALALGAGPAVGGTTGGSAESDERRSTMQDVLSEIQSLVERSNIINRTPHTDLNWYLKSSPGGADVQLVRTLQQVLACRYQPAQLSVTAMAKQLEEAQEYRRRVQEQVAAIKSKVLDPRASKRAEGQWSAALLDASATVQVKSAQLDQVKQYDQKMKIARAFLEVLAAEKENMSLNASGSSALQAEKLHALLQTMEKKKKPMLEDLLSLSSQLSVHLSDAESSGALLAQLGDVQEDWRLLEGSIKRDLQHASNSTCQSSLVLNEAKQLKSKVEDLLRFEINNLGILELLCLTTDLKLYNQIYLHLQSQSGTLINFSLGKKEKEELEQNLQGLDALLHAGRQKLDSFARSCGSNTWSNINKDLRDLVIWAKQAENHISTGQKLALFPEEARIQIVEMKKFQTDILSRKTKMHVQVEEIKGEASVMGKEDTEVLKTVEDLYEAIADSLDHVLDTMKKNLGEREKLLCELAGVDAWLAETHAKRDPCTHVENVTKASISKLDTELKSHRLATEEIENQLKVVELLSERCTKISIELNPGESRYLVNRVSGLWTELDGLLAHEKATSWELEELIHEWTSSNEELSTIQASLKQISAELERQKFPLTQEALSLMVHWKHVLMEHQCQVQELQHCQDAAKRNSMLCSVGELQDRCKALCTDAFEHDKYLHLTAQMEESRDIAKGQIQQAKNKAVSEGDRFRLCQTLLVELPLVKTQCQEAADQLEAISHELHPSELISERERIQHTVEALVSWEDSIANDIKNLEDGLLQGFLFNSELPALIEMLQNTREILKRAKPVNPEEKAIDVALQHYWVIWRNIESGMRVLEGLAKEQNVDLKKYKELYSLRDEVMQDCHSWMVGLSQARESLKDYQWAAQGAINFLHNAEATFLSAPGGFLDCTEEQRQTQQALQVLEDGFQALISHLMERVPQRPCLSSPKTELLHSGILSQLLVGRAVLEAQAQLRLECLQRCEIRQQSHRKCHEDIRHRLVRLEATLSECAAEQVTSYHKCVAQQRRVKLLTEDLRSLAVKIEDLGAGCPMQGCGSGKDGELGALWRRWVSLRRRAGVLMAHTEQRGEEWKDINTSMEHCCSFLASLQAEVPDSTVNFIEEEPQEVLAQAEMHQAGLEQEQLAISSLEHRLEHALSLSTSHNCIGPGPVGKALVKIQENVKSLKERNLMVVAAAQAEEREREHDQEELREVEKHLMAVLTDLEVRSNPSKNQELKKDLCSLKMKLKGILDSVQSRYAEIPVEIDRQMQEVQLTLRKAEDRLLDINSPAGALTHRVRELGSGLERVKALLEQRSPTVDDAQTVLKHAWDELDAWHSSLMLLESDVQDLAEEQPSKSQLLMDQLTEPLQRYQTAAQLAEHRTAFLSKIPACLQELEDILHRATSWLEEAQSWLSSSCSFTTAKSLNTHAKSLQLVQEDSERIRHTLQEYRSTLAEISAVCDVSSQEKRLDQSDQQVQKMQQSISEPLEQLLQTIAVVEAIEADLRMMEKNVPKIRMILSSTDLSDMTLMEQLDSRQVILASLQSMQTELEDIERCKEELHVAGGAEGGLTAFSKVRQLRPQLEELEQLTHEQVSLLENQISKQEETKKGPDFPTGSDPPEEARHPDRSACRRFLREAFEVSNSEEEEDEEAESCHSSSSDTLTCSIPEELEDTLSQREGVAGIKELDDIAHRSYSEVEMSSTTDKTSLVSVQAGLDPSSGSCSAGAVPPAPKVFSPKAVTPDSLTSGGVPATGEQFGGLQEPPKLEMFGINPQIKAPQVAAALEDTRLVPSRPVTPFSVTRIPDELREEEDEHLSLSTGPHPDLSNLLYDQDALQVQQEVSTCYRTLEEGSQQLEQLYELPNSLAGHEDAGKEQIWSRLHSQISLKLAHLRKLEKRQSMIDAEDGEKEEKGQQKQLASTGSSGVFQQIHEAISMLRKTARAVRGSHPGVKEDLYEALGGVFLCLDPLTELMTTPPGACEDGPQLRMLQQECASVEMATLDDLLGKVESQIKPVLSKDEADVSRCLTGLQDCLHAVQLLLTDFRSQLPEGSGLDSQRQELSSSQLCLLDEFDVEESEIFPSSTDAPSLEFLLGKHLGEHTEEKAGLQHASRTLLQGIAHLLDLGEDCFAEKQKSRVSNRSTLQADLCRHVKLLQVLRSQLLFVQCLFQREPTALEGQEDEWAQLEVRAKAVQEQALEHEVACQRMLQKWICWEDYCHRASRVLDESEALISSGEPEGDDDEELVQRRLAACEQSLVQLDESRVMVGLLLDQEGMLQEEPRFAASVSQAGGALELRWKSIYRRTHQEIQRCRDIQDIRTRFQTDFASVSEWLLDASERLKAASGLAGSSDLSQETVQSELVELLDFSRKVEAMSALRGSVSKSATRLLHLREADCPGLRAEVDRLEVGWSQLTSDLSRTRERLQQRLLAAQPRLTLLSELEERLKNTEAQLNQEKKQVLEAESSGRIAEVLQRFQGFKAVVVNGQLLLDFLSQPGPQVVGADNQASSSQRTAFAERLGSIRLQWLLVQRELECQIREIEQIHHACAEREGQLHNLHGWIEQQKKQLSLWRQPTSQTLACKALVEQEGVLGRVKDVLSTLQELRGRRVYNDKEEEHPSDVAFSEHAECVVQACEDLSQQIDSLGRALQKNVEEWACFYGSLRDVTLQSTRVRCALQHRKAPLLSVKQAEVYLDFLQDLQMEATEGEALWIGVSRSHQSSVETLPRAAVRVLGDLVEEERKRWKDTVQEIKDELMKTGRTLSIWKEFTHLSDNCSLHLHQLWHEWQTLSSSSLPPEDTVCSVQRLQDDAKELESSVGDMLAASKPLIGRLEPLAANSAQSETRLLSRDILLLNHVTSGRKRSLEEDLEAQKLFHTRLEALEKQMQNLPDELKTCVSDADSAQRVLFELSGLIPSLVDVKATSGCVGPDSGEMERLQILWRQLGESMTQVLDMSRELHDGLQRSQNFREKSEKLKSIQDKLELESMRVKSTTYSDVLEMLTVHQRLQAEEIIGHRLLQDLLFDAFGSMEKETGEKRSELTAQVAFMERSWRASVAVARRNQALTKEHLHQWRTYVHGSKRLWKLLRLADSFLPPAGPSLYTLQQLQSCADVYKCVEESLELHSAVYVKTVAAGRRLCESATEPECLSRLRSELQAVEEAWERTSSLLRRNRDLASTSVQMWSRSQRGLDGILSELCHVTRQLAERPERSKEESLIQETELSLQRLAVGLKEVATMKTDLSQYVAATDSALLEQQLELLGSQWEELCAKVSLRRQEIADRLNAWTIFNDKNKEFCDWLTQMENKVCHNGDLSIEEMVEKLKKDCMEEINLFSENKSHLKQLGEQLLVASDEAKQTQVHGSLQEINQRWHNLFHHIEARVKKLKETLVAVQQLDKNMSNLRSWLSRIEAELSKPITYSICHEQEIQRRLAEHQELQKDIEQHTEGVASVLSLCDVLLHDEDAASGSEAESDSLQETSRSLDQRWRAICAMALDRRLRIEETWTLWCKFLNDYSRFEDWLKMAERTAASPNSANVLFSVAKEELKRFEGFQRQVNERLTQLELINNQYRRLARENRTDRASRLKAMVREGNRRWDTLHRRVAAILRRLKHFTSQREEFEGTRESMLVWLTELDLQLTNVEHFSESDVPHKIQQLNSFQKEITLNTERIDGLIVFGEGLIQKSSPQDAELIEDELEELHSYCQEVFGRLVRFHQRLSQPTTVREEPELSGTTFTLESSLELIGRPWLGRSHGSLPVTPTHLLTSPLERSGRETPLSVDSLPLEWDHTVDVGSSSHEDDEEEEEHDEEGTYFSAVSSRTVSVHESPRWRPSGTAAAAPALTSTPLKQGYLRLMSQCSGSIENLKRVSLILDDEEQPGEVGLTGLSASDKQSGVIERWELLRAQSRCSLQADPLEPQQLTSDVGDITSWLEKVVPELDGLLQSDSAASVEAMEAKAKELKEMQKVFAHYKSLMLSANLQVEEAPELQERLAAMNRDWIRACTGLQQWDASLRKTLMRCQEFHETLHSLLLWLAHAESRRYAVDINHQDTSVRVLQQHSNILTELREELRGRQAQQASLQALWSQLQPEDDAEESDEAREKLHVTGSKLKLLLREVDQDLSILQQRLDCESAPGVSSEEVAHSKKGPSSQRETRESSPPRSFFLRVLRAAFPLQLLLLFLLLLPCIIPLSESDSGCTVTNNFARSFYPMLHYTNGPPPT